MLKTSITDTSFNPIEFETEREAIFNRTENSVIESDFELDGSDKDCFGTLYRVWKDANLIGTFYRRGQKWFAAPFYANGKCLKLADSLKQSFRSNESAINYIIRCYQGS